MQPLSPRVRAGYLYTFVALFIAVLPAVIMYADGWRWTFEDGFYKTGGVFISVPYQDADVSINGEIVGRSSFFSRSFYVSDLAPDAYVVHVEREGYLPWNRVLVVEPQIVTDADAFLFPKRVEFERLVVMGTATTGIAVVSRSQYDAYLAAFETVVASTTLPQDESDGVGLFVEGGDIYARWTSEDALPPSRFCGRPSFCARTITIERGSEEARTARFFGAGVVYVTSTGGVYFSEIDVRPTPLNVQLFELPDADIRVVDGALVVSTGGALYQISL